MQSPNIFKEMKELQADFYFLLKPCVSVVPFSASNKVSQKHDLAWALAFTRKMQ